MMNKKCEGCGALLQSENEKEIGYTRDLEKKICQRCFRIQHYNDYQCAHKKASDYLDILNEIDKKGDLILFVADFFLWSEKVIECIRSLKSPVLLVLSKRDIMPYSLKEERIKDYIESLSLPIVDMHIISSKKNLHLDSLLAKIQKYQKNAYVYVVGFTNAGKSTFINKMIYNYSSNASSIITSIMPSTTLDTITIPLNENLILVDTPGLLMPKNMMNEVSPSMLYKILPKKEIKPIMYPIKNRDSVYVEDLVLIKGEGHLTFYMSGGLCIERKAKEKNLSFPYKIQIEVGKEEELVIEGLGFIKVSKDVFLTLHLKYDVDVYTRKMMIGRQNQMRK